MSLLELVLWCLLISAVCRVGYILNKIEKILISNSHSVMDPYYRVDEDNVNYGKAYDVPDEYTEQFRKNIK